MDSTPEILSALVQVPYEGRADAAVEVDLMSCYPVIHLNFLFNHLLPVPNIKSRINSEKLKPIEAAEKLSPFLGAVSIERYGPVIDDVSVPDLIPRMNEDKKIDIEEADHNWLLVAEDMIATYEDDPIAREAKFIIEEVKDQAGMIVRLIIPDPDHTDLCKHYVNGKWYISAQELQKKIVAITEENLRSQGAMSCNHMESKPTDNEHKNCKSLEKSTCDVDTTKAIIAFPCEVGQLFDKWFARERKSGWPTKSTLEKTINKGCRLIPRRKIGPNSYYRDLEWEVVLDIDELCKSLNDTQKQCFILLKVIHFHTLSLPNILTNEHMLHLLLWVSESIPVENWAPENLGSNFCFCLRTLFDFVVEGHFSHYFIDDANMLSGVSEDHLFDLINILNHVMHNLVEEIYTFNDRYRMNYHPKRHCLRQLFAMLDEGAQTDSEDICKQKQMFCANDLSDALIDEELYTAACVACSTVENGETYLADRALQTSSLDQGIEIFQFLIHTFPHSNKKYSHLANMAVFYHCKYIDCEERPEKEKLQIMAWDAFKEAMEIPLVATASMVDYCVFLCDIREYNQAIPLLVKVVSLTKDKSVQEYDIRQHKTLPDELQLWVEHFDRLTVYSINLSQFLMIKCYTATEQTNDAYPVLHQMRLFLKSLSEKKSQMRKGSQVLLACSAQLLKRYKLACSVYEKINAQNPSPIAKQRVTECNDLLAEQKTEDSNEPSDQESEEDKPSSDSDNKLSGPVFTATEEGHQKSAIALLEQLRFEEALNDFTELQVLYKQHGKDVEPTELMADASKHLRPVVVALVQEFLIEKYPDSPNIWSFRDQLGCAYVAQSFADDLEEDREALKAKAIRTFEFIRAQNRSAYEYQMNYAMMLYSTGKYSKALELTDDVLKMEAGKTPEDSVKLIHTFDARHKSIVDQNIQLELRHTAAVEVPVNILAHYLTIMSAVKSNSMESAIEVFHNMQKVCEKIICLESTSLSQKLFIQDLLGYTALELKSFEIVDQAFTWVWNHATGAQKSFAEENLNTYYAMILCDST